MIQLGIIYILYLFQTAAPSVPSACPDTASQLADNNLTLGQTVAVTVRPIQSTIKAQKLNVNFCLVEISQNPVDTHMVPTNPIVYIISSLGLEQFNLVPKGVHHWPRLLHSVVNLVLYIRITDTIQRLVLEFGYQGDVVVKPLQLVFNALDLPNKK